MRRLRRIKTFRLKYCGRQKNKGKLVVTTMFQKISQDVSRRGRVVQGQINHGPRRPYPRIRWKFSRQFLQLLQRHVRLIAVGQPRNSIHLFCQTLTAKLQFLSTAARAGIVRTERHRAVPCILMMVLSAAKNDRQAVSQSRNVRFTQMILYNDGDAEVSV